jgi:purine-binding chemotaxis protein CheW
VEKQYVSFRIAEGKYCIDIKDVKEVVRENNITKMPDSPSFVEGIMNLRGIVVPVISVRKKLGVLKINQKTLLEKEGAVPKAESKKSINKMIIVNIDGVLIGFMVDGLDRVFTIDDGQIQSSEGIMESGIDRMLVSGVVKTDDSFCFVLDIKKLLDFEEKTFIQKEITE